MLINLKTKIRDLLPKRLQVPIKYWYCKVSQNLEEELNLLPKLVRSSGRAVDVGANRGVYAYRLSRLCAHVELFEPNPHCAAVLNAFALSRSNVRLHVIALSDQSGFADLRVPVDYEGVEHDSSATIERAVTCDFRSHRVRLNTLDSYEFNDIDFIKIDVEGHESRVIAGASETIRAQMPALLIEIEQRHCERPIKDIFEQVQGYGYEGFFLDAGGALRRLRDFNLAKHQVVANLFGRRTYYINNFLFLHSKKLQAGEYESVIRRG